MKKNDITELVFILDRSGSMAGLVEDTIGGFNAMIETQKQQEGTCYVSTILFDNTPEVLHDRLALKDIPPMTRREYTVRGCTALLDAVGYAIRHIARIHKYARPEDVPARTLFVITTDGMENASRHFTLEQIWQNIRHEKEKYGWEFLFLGANIDAVTTARNFGIAPERAVNYHADAQGTDVIYTTVAETAVRFRAGKAIGNDWSRPIQADYEGRKYS